MVLYISYKNGDIMNKIYLVLVIGLLLIVILANLFLLIKYQPEVTITHIPAQIIKCIGC